VTIMGLLVELGTFLDTQSALAIVLFLVAMTVFFEALKDRVDEAFVSWKPVLIHIWSELTVLGFLALVTYLLIKSEALQAISRIVFEDPEHLVHMFEDIHFSLFFVLVLFLVLSLFMLTAAATTVKQWSSYREFIRSYEKVSVHPKAKKQVLDFGRAACEDAFAEQEKMLQQRLEKRMAGYRDKQDKVSIYSKLLGEAFAFLPNLLISFDQQYNPFVNEMWDFYTARERLRFQRLRHRFLLRPLDQKAPFVLLPPDFEFASYMLECVNQLFEHVMHLGVASWKRVLIVMLVVYEVTAFFGSYAFGLFGLFGWAMFFFSLLAVEHYEWVLMELMPIPISVKNPKNPEDELQKLRKPNLVFYLYKPCATILRKLLSRELGEITGSLPTDTKNITETVISRPARSASTSGLIGRMGMSKKIDMESAVQEREYLHPGRYALRKVPANLAAHGEGKQSALFLNVAGGHGHGHGHGHGEAHPADRAMHPAALLLQGVILLSALYFTILVVFREPQSFWDIKVAILAFPMLMVDIFTAPDLISPMVLSLSTEDFRYKKVADKIEKDAKLGKFAKAAKLLRAIRAKAVILKKQRTKGSSDNIVPKSYEQLMAELEGDERKKVLDLKEAFENFDTDHSGDVDLHELEPLISSLGLDVPKAEVQQLIEQLDLDNDGKVSFPEFAHRMLADEEDIDPEDAAAEIFLMIDTDKSGTLDVKEVQDAFKKFNTGLSPDELHSIIDELDDDDSGKISKEEFVTALTKIFEGE